MTLANLSPLLSLVGSILGAFVAGYVVNRSASLALERSLKEQCYAAFLRFHTTIASVTEEHAPMVGGERWHEEYQASCKALEPVANELIALTKLLLNNEIAEKVAKTRFEFRRWDAFEVSHKMSDLPGEQRASDFRKLVSGQPLLIAGLLDELSVLYRSELRSGFRSGW